MPTINNTPLTARQSFDQSTNSYDRNQYTKLYNGRQWRKMSIAYRKQNPLCEMECKSNGLLKPAKVVDHIKPHRGDLKLFYDWNNLQSACHRCHNRKSGREAHD